MLDLPILIKIGCFLEVIIWLMIAWAILFVVIAWIYDFFYNRKLKRHGLDTSIEYEDYIRELEFMEDIKKERIE